MVEPNSTIVARGLVVKTQATTIHRIEMDLDTVWVELNVVIDPFTELLILINDEIYLVEHVVGTLVLWPKELVYKAL